MFTNISKICFKIFQKNVSNISKFFFNISKKLKYISKKNKKYFKLFPKNVKIFQKSFDEDYTEKCYHKM